jgi:energy-coupling factor transport system substrate-specific component
MIIYGIFLNIIPYVWKNYPFNPIGSAAGTTISIFIYVGLFIIGILYRLEESNLTTKEVVLIAMYSTFVGVARIPFAAIPSVQPCSFLIFCAGYVFGPLIGFAVAIITVLISNMFLGHGPWSIYQMIGWGFFGVIGGLINHSGNKPPNHKLNMVLGFIFGFLYGWLLNLWFFLNFVPEHTLRSFIATNLLNAYLDLMHAVANVIFFHFFGDRTINILYRYRNRFFFEKG